MTENNLVLLEKYYRPTIAHIARSVLESHNIPCVLFDEHHHSVNWLTRTALGGVRLMVPPEHLEAARIILLTTNEQADVTDEPLLPNTKRHWLLALLATIGTTGINWLILLLVFLKIKKDPDQ